ncbi:MAG: DUF2147 domain-containing protein [Woeseiaceae bacterium]|nr:DUF2147 domain-containing protein [Woeseiaceae bacterium]
MKLLCRIIVVTGLMLVAAPLPAAGNDVFGTWLTGDGDGWVTITPNGTGLSGVIAGSPNDDAERSTVDDKNPDPELRSRKLIGLELFTGFRFDGDDRWVDGTIYDPNSGKTYRCIITIRDRNTLRVRGYIGFSLLGRTETWTRRIEADDSGEPD